MPQRKPPIARRQAAAGRQLSAGGHAMCSSSCAARRWLDADGPHVSSCAGGGADASSDSADWTPGEDANSEVSGR